MIQGGEQFALEFCLQLQLPGGGVYGQTVRRRVSITVGKHATAFSAELYNACLRL
jgi:hypothetical protein